MKPDPAVLQLSAETAVLRKAVEEARLSLAYLLGEWEERVRPPNHVKARL